jgi:hypothetical protein
MGDLKLLARPKRFELLTPRFVVWCSIQLSYGRLRLLIDDGIREVNSGNLAGIWPGFGRGGRGRARKHTACAQAQDSASSSLTCRTTLSQSPIFGCLNSRAVGYQGLS